MRSRSARRLAFCPVFWGARTSSPRLPAASREQSVRIINTIRNQSLGKLPRPYRQPVAPARNRAHVIASMGGALVSRADASPARTFGVPPK
jgi:hypothetical protein